MTNVEQSPAEIDKLTDQVSIEWLDDRRIAVLSVRTNDRKEVAIWADKNEELIRTWRKDSPYAVLHDVQYAFLSPYARSRAEKTSQVSKDTGARGRYAVLVANNVFGMTISAFVNFKLRNKSGEGIKGQCFTSREAALAWLREQF
jgi:hypothetical protein